MRRDAYVDFMTNPKTYDACRRIWKRLLLKAISLAEPEWSMPWFGEHYGNGTVIREGTMATAVAGDWSRGISIEQIPSKRGDVVVFDFVACRVLVPDEMKPARRLAIRATMSKNSRNAIEALARAWSVDRVSESQLLSIAMSLGAKHI